LQVAFPGAERIPDERNEIYFRVLLPIIEIMTPDQAERGFQRCIRECRRYPSIAEIIEKLGVDEKTQNELAGHNAWEAVQKSLREWGVDRMPLFRGGRSIYPPPFDKRTEYAIRAVGGLRRISSATDHEFGFIQREFLGAWARYDGLCDFQIRDLLPAGDVALLDGQVGTGIGELFRMKSMDNPGNQSIRNRLPNNSVASPSGNESVLSGRGKY
jgi:hypothetical protein